MLLVDSTKTKSLALLLSGISIFLLAAHTACTPRSEVIGGHVDPGVNSTESPVQSPQPSPVPSSSGVSGAAVTFYRDVLPILRSNNGRRNYRCLVCHSSYSKAEIVAKPRIMDAIISSIETQYMPPDKNRILPEDLEVLKLWRRSGMQHGTVDQTPPLDGALNQ